jgi:hypothetical protein
LKTRGIPVEALKIAPVVVVGFAEAGVGAACLGFMFISVFTFRELGGIIFFAT